MWYIGDALPLGFTIWPGVGYRIHHSLCRYFARRRRFTLHLHLRFPRRSSVFRNGSNVSNGSWIWSHWIAPLFNETPWIAPNTTYQGGQLSHYRAKMTKNHLPPRVAIIDLQRVGVLLCFPVAPMPQWWLPRVPPTWSSPSSQHQTHHWSAPSWGRALRALSFQDTTRSKISKWITCFFW